MVAKKRHAERASRDEQLTGELFLALMLPLLPLDKLLLSLDRTIWNHAQFLLQKRPVWSSTAAMQAVVSVRSPARPGVTTTHVVFGAGDFQQFHGRATRHTVGDRRRPGTDVILAVSERLNLDKAGLKIADVEQRAVFFKNVPNPKTVFDFAEQLSG